MRKEALLSDRDKNNGNTVGYRIIFFYFSSPLTKRKRKKNIYKENI